MKQKYFCMSNKIIKNCNLSPSVFNVYINIKIYTIMNDKNNFELNDIIKQTNLSKNPLLRCLKTLEKEGILIKGKSYNSINKTKVYKFNDIKTTILGYTMLNVNFLFFLLEGIKEKKITKRQFQIFIYLISKKENEIANLTQAQIGKNFGVTRNLINMSLKNINLEFINRINTTYPKEFKNIYNYMMRCLKC